MSGVLTIVASPGGGDVPDPVDPFQGGIPGGAPTFFQPTGGTPTGVLQSGGLTQSFDTAPPSSSSFSSSSSSFSSSSSPSSSTGSSPTSTTGSTSTPTSAASPGTKTSSSSTTLPSGVSTSNTISTSHNKSAIIGGVVGGVVGLLIITALVIYYRIRRSRRNARVTAFEVPSDKIVEPTHPPPPKPDISTTNLPSVSGSNTTYSIPVDAQQKIDESANHENLPVITMPGRDSLIDQSMSHPNRSSPELIRSTLPIVSHNPRDLNPLLREILNVTQGRNPGQGPSDSGDPNVPQNIQIFIINQPSNRDGSVANENGENRGVHYGRSSPRNMDVDTLSLPPSYE